MSVCAVNGTFWLLLKLQFLLTPPLCFIFFEYIFQLLHLWLMNINLFVNIIRNVFHVKNKGRGKKWIYTGSLVIDNILLFNEENFRLKFDTFFPEKYLQNIFLNFFLVHPCHLIYLFIRLLCCHKFHFLLWNLYFYKNIINYLFVYNTKKIYLILIRPWLRALKYLECLNEKFRWFCCILVGLQRILHVFCEVFVFFKYCDYNERLKQDYEIFF